MQGFTVCLNVLSARWKFIAFMNLIFFGCAFGVASASEFLPPPAPYLGLSNAFHEMLSGSGFPLLLLSIFLSNLVLSSFIVVSVPGIVFFPLSTVFLVYRGIIWGLLLHQLPTWVVLAAMPTIVLEGSGYSLAAVAGTLAGVSWIKPNWVYAEENLTRNQAFRRALKECLVLYAFVGMILLFAAGVEAATLLAMG
jgi:hypothetical protein